MFEKVLLLFSCTFVLSGCVFTDEPMPKITHIYSSELVEPLPLPPKPTRIAYGNIPRSWIPAFEIEKKWTAIIIHHSNTKNGNATIFDNYHRKHMHWEGIGYDFVIGNGTDSGDGQVEVTYRWREQKTGAHCGGTAGNWANKEGIGICLVGNFNAIVPTKRQMQSLVKLVRFLQSRYGIRKSRIYGHGSTPGTHITDCPGRNFSLARLKSMLDY